MRTASDADPDPPFNLAADPDPDPAFYSDPDPDPTCHLMRIQLLLLIKGIRLSDHRSTDPPLLHFEHARLHCDHGHTLLHFEPLQFLNLDFDADPNLAFYFDADPVFENYGMRIHADPGTQR